MKAAIEAIGHRVEIIDTANGKVTVDQLEPLHAPTSFFRYCPTGWATAEVACARFVDEIGDL